MKQIYDINGRELKLHDPVRCKKRKEQQFTFNGVIHCDATGWTVIDYETDEESRFEDYIVYYGHHVPDVTIHDMLQDGLTTRLYHSLLQCRLVTLQQIVDKGIDYVWKMPRVGSESVNILNEICKKYGVNLLKE